MALEPYGGFLGPDSRASSYMADSEKLVNMYPQPTESPSAPSPWELVPTPGYRLLASVPQAPGRANFSENGRNFFIAGFAFQEYAIDAVTGICTTTLRGTVVADSNPAMIVGNGVAGGQLGIVSGNRYYSYDLATNVLTLVRTGATMVGFLDGFFLVFDRTISTVFVSNLFNGLVLNPLNIFQRTAGSDAWQAMYIVNRLIYLLGSATSEVWWNANVAVGQPFAPIQEAFSEFGIAATFSGAVDTSLTFLGRNANGRGIVYRMQGYTPQRISQHSEEVAIQSYSRMDDAVAGITQQQGRPIYVLTFPTADKTHCFDEGTSLWHARETWDEVHATAHASRAMFFAALPTMSVSCDRQTGDLVVIDPSVYTEADGSLIQHYREAPRLSFNQRRFTVPQFQLVMDVGIGLNTGQGSNPMVMLQVSRDGGKVFGNERWTSAGKMGAFGTRVMWKMLGQARNFVPRVMVTDPVPFKICDALIDARPGTS